MEDPRPCDANALCDNSPGTYRCQCLDGYRDATDVPGKECDDINECNEGTFVYFFAAFDKKLYSMNFRTTLYL